MRLVMRPHPLNPCFLTAVLGLGAVLPAGAACNAGNPNWAVAESTPDGDFNVDVINGTVTHAKTGLTWKRCAEGFGGDACATAAANGQATFDWANALASAVAANAAAHGGYNDWRLPNKKELESIAEYCGFWPAINRIVFPSTPPDNFFWTASTYLRDPNQAWMVTSGNGATGYDSKSTVHYVRLVRGGTAGDPFDVLRTMHSVTGRFPRLITMDSE